MASVKKRKVWPWVVGGSVLAFLLLLGGGIAIIVSLALGATNGPRDAVVAYDKAWQQVDCDLLQSVTTGAVYYDDCTAFEDDASAFNDSYGDYKVTVVNTNVMMGTATVQTNETYTEDGEKYTDHYTYTLVQEDGAWKISDAVVD
jgi:hypothetical protein